MYKCPYCGEQDDNWDTSHLGSCQKYSDVLVRDLLEDLGDVIITLRALRNSAGPSYQLIRQLKLKLNEIERIRPK